MTIIFFISFFEGFSTIKYNELLIKFPGNFSLVQSSEGLNIDIKFILPFSIVDPFGNKILVPFGPYIEFSTSNIAGEALFIPSRTINLFGKLSLHSIAWHSGVFELTKLKLPFSFFLKIVLHNKSSTLVDFEIGT